jgi:hypothetical protein
MVIAEAPSETAAPAAFDKVDVRLLPKEIGDLYAQLAREDLPVHQSPQVAQGLPYISGETVRQVLNQVIGIHRWSFKIVEHGLHPESDEYWALGRLTVWFPYGQSVATDTALLRSEREIIHENFGSSKVKRSRATGAPLNLGFDQKAAATEALKKCASDLGIGLWLSRKESAFWDAQEAGEPPKPGSGSTRTQSSSSRPAATRNGSSAADSSASANGSASATNSTNGSAISLVCEVCGTAITGQPTELGSDPWDGPKLAGFGKKNFGHAVCWPHYRAFKARKDNKSLPDGAKPIPPENEWHINAQPSLSAASSTRPRPSAQQPSAESGRSAADHLVNLKTGLANLAKAHQAHQALPADLEQGEWVLGTFYDVIGDRAEPMVTALFGENLSVADVDAVEEWIDKESADNKWAKRLEIAAQALPSQPAAA